MFVRTVNGYMYYPGTALTSTSGAAALPAPSASPAAQGGTTTLAAMGSTTGITHTGLNGIRHHNPLNGSTLTAPTANGALTGYTHPPTAGGLNGLNGISTGINGLGTTGLSGGLAAMSTTTALMGTVGAKWMLPDWSALGLRFPLLGHRMGKKPGGGPNKQVKCDICNITLNSELQAQQHYNGKNHLKKMKQVGMTMPGEEEGKRIIKQYGRKAQLKDMGSEKGEDGETSSSSDAASEPPNPSEPKDQPKEPKTIQLQPGQAPPVNDCPSQTVTSEGEKLDPVTQAIYDNMMGKLPKKRKLEIPCAACDMVFNSEVHAEQHFKGIRHAKRLKMLETTKDNPEGKKEEGSTVDDSKPYKCQHCSVSMDTQNELDEHNESIDHKTTMGRIAAASPTVEEQNKQSPSKPKITLHSPKHDIKSSFRSAGIQQNNNNTTDGETSPP